tara:strand:+ start:462 stop:2225 length:1764 start_codon:yes stop_codon:yes gene_type:complete
MAYGSRINKLRTTTTQTSSKSANVELNINTPDGDYLCRTGKVYNDKVSIITALDDSDAFITLSEFSKSYGATTVHTAKAIVIKNVSDIAQEIAITVSDWKNDGGADAASDTTTDITNSVDINAENSTGEETVYRTWSMILSGGEFYYLPTSRLVSYAPYSAATLESAGNSPAGTIAIEPKAIASGAEIIPIHLFAGTTYNSGADIQIAQDITISATEFAIDDSDWFEVGDLIAIGTEIMEVESITGNDLTVKRGLLGSTQVAHSDDDDLNFFIGNENFAFNNGKCQTDQNGRFSQRGAFFSYGRSATKKGAGIVAGSVAIGPFYTQGGYLDWGLQNIKASDKTGLAVSTTYTFHIVVDEYSADGFDGVDSETAIAFTTDAGDTTFAGSSNAVIPKIQAVLNEKFYDASSGLFNKKVSISLRNGDIRVNSLSNNSVTRVGIGNVSGTTPFGVGRFPAISSSVPVLLGTEHGGGTTDNIVYGPASTLPPETIEDSVTGKIVQNLNAFILDDGNGNLLHNGSSVGSINYVKGHCNFTHLPNAEFKIYAKSLSAHSGGSSYIINGYNSIYNIKARSLNAKADSKVELLLLG